MRARSHPPTGTDRPEGSSHTGQRFADTLREAITSLFARPGRTALLCLGAALGTAVLAASLTLAAAASAQVGEQFDQLRSTRITVTNPTDQRWLEPDNLDRLRQLPGVTMAGDMRQSQDVVPISRLDANRSTPVPTTLTAATPGALQAEGATIRAGRLYDAGATQRADSVVVIGAALARSLDLPEFNGHTEITIAGTRALVIGIIDAGAKGDPNLLLGAYVPNTRSLASAPIRWQPPTVVINTELRATDGLAIAVPIALAPGHVESLIVQTPPDPQGLQSAVSTQLQLLLLVLGGISLVIGIVVIGTATVSAVTQRRTEIALRRALGTSRAATYLQILTETSLTGAAGGILGAYLGQVTTAILSAANDWPITTNLALIPAGALVGLVSGALAGIYPAATAATAEPARALRS